ncbi:MazG nucleotide pyrophosphohydrolase domain-containing protein [Macrococcoides canis]|uniref:Nucleotide pyrophosphohydrolase n=1 Tax=Macrococcoides canis TaxID=1855823 RepID=A0AAE6X351_9STAP|nr:MazG nucleotide pyrophosphohydrolase domain-containing protein [Macrococcus canis]MCO4097394.1 nucleotide pyrophosphohydrolase [Macrococcus canis]QCT75752.1 nucleotide pyrophosphohydrolase [Macrococcus canis]QIH79399.1 nucleotide pyrophosphohydrolase [Macrococcus canis]QUR94702.1 nucleotide pyrophosphohydrolase [Macrococcus canis]UTH02362.1 nucleotide pyrophosphohydrolase [Macrococcus canis]
MGKITVVGLGNYGLDELPFGIYRFLNKVERVYVRTLAHPVVEDLEDIEWISFDEVYEKHDQFSEVYAEIVQTLKEKAMDDDIVYAVPGHPMVAESTTELLLQDEAIDIEVLGGKSFIDDLFQAVSFDPNNGFQMLDGTMMTSEAINIRNALIITQVYDQMIAGDVKVTLMEKYPDNHNVAIVTGARGQGSAVKWCPLYEMDHDFELSNLTSLFVPALRQEHYAGDFEYLSSIMDTLVADDGCPFDKAQTHSSLKRYLLEETYELFEAIDNDDIDHMIEELGDILLQVVFHGAIGKKSMMFDTREIVQGISEKMIRRHPHIFGEGVEVNSIEELNQVWKNAKQAEGKEEKQVKQEKIFADLYLKLYDLVNNQQMTVQQALKVLAGEENETR